MGGAAQQGRVSGVVGGISRESRDWIRYGGRKINLEVSQWHERCLLGQIIQTGLTWCDSEARQPRWRRLYLFDYARGLEREVLPRLPLLAYHMFHSALGRRVLLGSRGGRTWQKNKETHTHAHTHKKKRQSAPRRSLDLPALTTPPLNEAHLPWPTDLWPPPWDPSVPRGRSARVATACEPVASHRSPPLSLQGGRATQLSHLVVPPLWGNSIRASPPSRFPSVLPSPTLPPTTADGTDPISVSSHPKKACSDGPSAFSRLLAGTAAWQDIYASLQEVGCIFSSS